jgi:hypothetical protein
MRKKGHPAPWNGLFLMGFNWAAAQVGVIEISSI